MKTLLQINSVINYGSTGRITEQIGRTASENGWKSYIAYARYNASGSTSDLIRIGNKLDIVYHGLITRLTDRHGLASERATIKLISQIKQIKPDIIHLHNIHGYYINIKILFVFLRDTRIPVIWTLHDCWPITGHCAFFDTISCEKWKTHCNNCPQIKEYPSSFVFDRSFQNYKLKKELFTSINQLTIVTVSNWLGNYVKDSFLNKFQVEIINNGIDISKFKSSNNSSLISNPHFKDKTVILGVSNVWDDRKGLNDFIELRKKLNNDFSIVLIGLTESQIKKIPDGVLGLGRTGNIEELAELYSISDIFCNPTWDDNFPTTNLESLSCGTPVITYNTGGSIESVTEETGFVVEKGDINGLVYAIETIRQKGKTAYSGACRARAEKMYDSNKQYKKYIELYDRILKNRN